MAENIIIEMKMAAKESSWLNHIINRYELDSFTVETCIEFIKAGRDKDAVMILDAALN